MNHTTTYYKLCHSTDDTKEFYIGSTDNIKNRISKHNSTYKDGTRQLKLYRYIYKNGGMDNWKFEILEEVENEQKYDKLLKEAEYIRKLKPTLNSNVPGANSYDYEATYLCGRCGIILKGNQQTRGGVKSHHKTKKCINTTNKQIIINDNHGTINFYYPE